MNDTARKIIGNRWLTCISRAALGGILIIASVGKLQDHATFTNAVVDYGILPDFLARAYGFALPWAELFIGCCLVLGVFVRFASLLSIPIIFSFIVANVYGLLHTTPDMCGCLGKLVLLSHPVSLGIDIAMLLLAGQLWLNNRSGEFLSIGPLIYRLSTGSGGAVKFLFEKGSMLAVVVLAMALLACFAPDISGEPANAYLSISVDPGIGGSVTLSPPGDTYESGAEVTLTATAEDGYIFDHWSGDLSGSVNPATITMNSNKTVAAHFTATVWYTLTVEVDPVYGGNEVQISQPGPYEPGTVVTLTADPAAGYIFDHWSGDASGNTDTVTITMDSNKTVTAQFTATDNYTLTVVVDPVYGGNEVQISPLQDLYEPGTVVTLTADPAEGYIFDHWSGVSGDTSQVTITMDSNKTVTAHFTATDNYTLTVVVDPDYGGTIHIIDPFLDSYEPGTPVTYESGTPVKFKVTPSLSKYLFLHWEMGGDNIGEENPITIIMDSNKTITAKIDCG